MAVVSFERNQQNSEDPVVPAKPEASEVLLDSSSESNELDESVDDEVPAPIHSLDLLSGIFALFTESFFIVYRISRWIVRFFANYIWHHPGHALFSSFLIVLLAAVSITGSQIYDHMILSKISDETVDQVIEASKYTRDFNALDVASSGAQEFLGVGAPDWAQRESIRAILFNARKERLSIEHQAVLLAIAEVESGFNPMAKAPTTTACGIYQFVKNTGLMYNLRQSECMNPWRNAEAGIAHYIDNYRNRVQVEVSGLDGPEGVFRTFELSYYLHHDGPMSTSSSNDVKAVILSGTQFLFKAYQVLQQETESQRAAPSFAERFTENFWEVLHNISRMFTDGTRNSSSKDKSEDSRSALNTSYPSSLTNLSDS
ncbi:MAG: transglycosylase SLT domain-containing protein [Bdellovibrionales bacterium]|nr:transglycosylase SLT domain-containing protein [Bdellovibrionales bacterium]